MTSPISFNPQAAAPDQVRITAPDRQALLAEIAAFLAEGRGFTLATLNLDHAVKLTRDPAFRRAYLAHSHVCADGNPIVWLSGLAGQRVELIPGSELVQPLAALAAEQGVGVALVGSTPEALDLAAARLQTTYPRLRIVARIPPPFGFDPEGEAAGRVIEEIGASGACLCLLALGAPKQEIFAARAARELPHCGFVSIGAGLDFIAGHQKRAPLWVRWIAMEWLWRMLSSPRRLARRYLDCVLILPGLARDALRQRGGPRNPA